jgi:predicted DNA-binding transcriptional regulator YafY
MDTTLRLLQMLALLPVRAVWTAEELAERLEVSPRTVRRDVARLREMGYAIDADPGRFGGYRLARGQALPPLVLSDDEAVAVAIGLRNAALSGIERLDESALTALGKLEQVLPSRLRDRVTALGSAIVHAGGPVAHPVDADVLASLALACQRDERVLLGYRDHTGRATRRDVDPHKVVHTIGRWYLVARDVRRGEWRTFRVDRVTAVHLTGARTRLDERPDAAALVTEALALGPYRWRATVRLRLPVEEARRRVPHAYGRIAEEGGGALLRIGADDLGWLATFLAGLGCDLEVVEPAELGDELRRLGRRLSLVTVATETTTVGSGEVRRAADLLVEILAPLTDRDWSVTAGDLEWSARQTLEHVLEGLVFYARDLATPVLSLGEDELRLVAADGSSVASLIEGSAQAAAIVAVVVAGSPPDRRAFHPAGMADPEGFAAMACDEILVHTHDIARGFGVDLDPPDDLCAAVLARLFPWVSGDEPPWDLLLWANGRTELPGHPRRAPGWRWHAAPIDEWDGTVPE